ncbi:MAG: diguanylate cyclase [Clostridiaceae bacterium]|nr:diguanylate cyclase [Clostridiaceae bacterium]
MNEEVSGSYIQEYRYKYVVENINDIVWEMDANLIFTYVSPSAKRIYGYGADEMIGKPMLSFLTEESKEYVSGQWKAKINSRKDGDTSDIVLYDLQFLCKDKTIKWVEASVKPLFSEKSFIGYIGTTRDISEKKIHEIELKKYYDKLEAANIELEKLATFDALTGAYNRRRFEEYINSAVNKEETHGIPFSIIMFDIDRFKLKNDTCGHIKGDRILQEISQIVINAISEEDKLFRWGGDEFIILISGKSSEDTYKVAERIRDLIESNDFGIKHDKVTISIGVGEHKSAESMDQFVSRVDDALLTAKSGGRNKVEMC